MADVGWIAYFSKIKKNSGSKRQRQTKKMACGDTVAVVQRFWRGKRIRLQQFSNWRKKLD